ncbi:hypothetical protein LJB42_001397 [Komagataella kurtzmanii]|nr:hypothetical protein LJB42_001397 [Komagataella kurtzmanii]
MSEDPRRPDEVTRNTAANVVGSTLPMAAMFLRNKVVSWSALFIALQAYLNEPRFKPQNKDGPSQPGLMTVGFALLAVLTSYTDVLFPTPGVGKKIVPSV